MKDDWWLEVEKFKKSGIKERIVTFKLPKKDRILLKDYPEWYEKEIQCRLIKVELSIDESDILCISLTNMGKHLYDDFVQLYHYRWNEEEAYKLLKCRLEVEKISGKTAIAVKQDFMQKCIS